MRAEAVLIATLVLTSCAVNIGSESDSSVAPRPAPALSGCLPLADRVSTLSGRVSQITLPDDSSLVIASSATLTGASTESNVGFSGADPACLTLATALPARPILDMSVLTASGRGRPLAAVTAGSDAFLYFSDDHSDGLATDGIGVARWDAASSSFLALTLLWTADRPSYGSAAALVGDEVYVLGGLAARFLAADVYLARVPVAQLAEPSAYEYWQGGGNFGSDPDSALPLVAGGTAPSLAFDVQHRRWLLAYAEPLASEVKVRTGLGVTGPWSQPYSLGRCDLPASDPSAFCGDVTLIPELATNGGIAFTQVVATFSRPAGSTDQDYWTRLVRTPWPSALP